jgi:MFS family permease
MLSGSVAGGFLAQATNLGVPYIVRGGMLIVTFLLAAIFMKDLGFTPTKGKSVGAEMKEILSASVKHGLRNPPVRWIMLAAPFSAGVGFFAFYAMQPYLLELYGSQAYGIAGLAAAIVAAAQIVGGIFAAQVRRFFRRRTTVLVIGTMLSAIALAVIGVAPTFLVAIAVLVVWAMVFAAVSPVRQAYLNGLIPSSARATVLSFDSLVGSTGGVVVQPLLGRVADLSGYGFSYLVSAAVQLAAIPFGLLARAQKAPSDRFEEESPKK